MNATTMLDFKNLVTTDRFVNMREIQKSPKNTLTGFKIIMNGSKAKGIYMDMNEREEYLEDIAMIRSASYKQEIADSRLSGQPISADHVW